MTNDKPKPSDPSVELNEETVADLDTDSAPAGGARAYTGPQCFSSHDHPGHCDTHTCVRPNGCS